MNRAVPLSQFMPYGAPDLIAAGPSHMSRAVIASSALAAAAFLLVMGALPLLPKAPTIRIRIPTTIISLAPELLPRLMEPAEPQSAVRPQGEPDEGQILPTPETAMPAEPDVPARPGDPAGDASVKEAPPIVVAPGGEFEEAAPKRGAFVYTDELPIAAREVKPEYPPFAREAGVEGRVGVHVLVGKDGRVIAAEVDEKFSILLLNEAAVEAARRWVFKPALANNRPVQVWVRLMFRFRLND